MPDAVFLYTNAVAPPVGRWYNRVPKRRREVPAVRNIKICISWLLTVGLLLCCACGARKPDTGSGGIPADTGSAAVPHAPLSMPYIGIILKAQNNPYFQLIKAGAEDEADAEGVQVMVFSPDAEDNTVDQADMLLTMANMSVDVIAIAPSSAQSLTEGLTRAAENGKILMAVDTVLPFDGCACYIGTDHYNAAYRQGVYAAKLAEGSGRAVILRGREDDRAHTLRTYGLEDGLKAGGAAVAETAVCGSEEEAEQTVTQLLAAHPERNIICTTFDSAAVGAQRAAAHAGRDDVHIVSFDGMPEVSELVRAGEIDAAVAQDPYRIGQLCVQNAVRLYHGETVPESIHTDAELITPDNAQAHMEQLSSRLKHKNTK